MQYIMMRLRSIQTKRDEFQNKIFESLKNEFANRGIELESLLVRNIMLPESVKTTIESK
jgi:regulator of protease activity HflC (stomatin/prohibitin superfamily)